MKWFNFFLFKKLEDWGHDSYHPNGWIRFTKRKSDDWPASVRPFLSQYMPSCASCINLSSFPSFLFSTTLVRFGAKETALIVDEKQWWRLFSPIMVHAGILHILPNVAIQVCMGTNMCVHYVYK